LRDRKLKEVESRAHSGGPFAPNEDQVLFR
jgi:hypothetical protein